MEKALFWFGISIFLKVFNAVSKSFAAGGPIVTFRKTVTCFGQSGISKATPESILQFLSVCLSVLSWCSLLKVSVGTRKLFCPCSFSHLTPLASFLFSLVCLGVLCLYFTFYFSCFDPSASCVAETMASPPLPSVPALSFAPAKLEEACKWALPELSHSTEEFSV